MTRNSILYTLVLLLLVYGAFGQSTASLNGTLTDPTGAVLSGAAVTAIDIATDISYLSLTNEKGEYYLTNMVPSKYKLRIQKSGSATIEVERMELLVGQAAARDFSMTLAATQETVSVTSEAPLIDTQHSDVNSNIDRNQLQNMPLQGRNWMTMVMLAKGITAND